MNENKSNVVCIYEEIGRRKWMMGDYCIGEVKEYTYDRRGKLWVQEHG